MNKLSKTPFVKWYRKMKQKESYQYDFAISYAGEEKSIAQGIHDAIKERYANYSVFFALKEIDKLVGKDGEIFFDKLFVESKQVIVVLSENYKRKEWTRYEWDIIKERSEENRCIPIKVDRVKILGLPSNLIYLSFENNFNEISEICIKRLLQFEQLNGIDRDSDLQKLVKELKNSKGAVDKAAQLVYDDRKRTPLSDISFPAGEFKPSYKIVDRSELNFSKLKRIRIDIDLADNLSKDEIKYNIKYLTATTFNSEKPDGIKIFVYCKEASNFQGYEKFNVARADFAPYGEWGRSEEGFAYNLPVDKFEWKIEFEESYFNRELKMETPDEMAERLVLELLKNKKH
jgi:hypothetical protein